MVILDRVHQPIHLLVGVKVGIGRCRNASRCLSILAISGTFHTAQRLLIHKAHGRRHGIYLTAGVNRTFARIHFESSPLLVFDLFFNLILMSFFQVGLSCSDKSWIETRVFVRFNNTCSLTKAEIICISSYSNASVRLPILNMAFASRRLLRPFLFPCCHVETFW